MNPVTAVIIVGLVLATLLAFGLIARIFRKVGRNQALIIYGFGGTQIVTGGGRVILCPWFRATGSSRLS